MMVQELFLSKTHNFPITQDSLKRENGEERPEQWHKPFTEVVNPFWF